MIAIVCIGGGESQLPIIKRINSLGYKSIVIDKNPKAIGFRYAFEKINYSTFFYKPIIRKLKLLSKVYKIKCVINRSSGPPVITASKICNFLDIESYSTNTANKIINKHLLYKECQKMKIHCPNGNSYKFYSKVNYKNLIYPCVVKPSLCLDGKHGISIIKKYKSLKKAFYRAKSSSINKKVIIENFIKGEDVSLISIVKNGKLFPVTLLDEINKIYNHNRIIGRGYIIPSKYTNTNVNNKINLIAKKLIKYFDLKNTFLIINFRVDNTQPFLIEIHLDLGGDLLLEKLFPKTINIDILNLFINMLMNKNSKYPSIKIKNGALIFKKHKRLDRNHPSKTFVSRSNSILLKKIIKYI